MLKFWTFSKNALGFSRSVLEFFTLTKLQKQTTNSRILALLKTFHVPVICNCSSGGHVIKPNPILAKFMPIGMHVYLCLYAWV